ncbi:LamG domain-containing protein [Luteolibacter yonseiensis]|uniref:LamG domain-containing protein n=1 Tax=Luteolibacter yonseiensis TaxID=1144680 RepID=A0A934R4W7_9BACT|nr:LamG domain-containing protein [Luteolibacter yonseiensis]MBK1818478.1 LamG domain-containing protein [Luteolibacter yonseiensis]
MKKHLLFLSAACLVIPVTAEAALISHYTFDELTGTTAVDSGPAGADGLIGSNVTRGTAGVFGTAFTFNNDASQNGIVDMADAATFPYLVASQAVTISAWMKWTAADARDSAIFLGNNTGANRYIDVGTTSAGKIYGRSRDAANSATPFPDLVLGTNLNDGKWHHVAYTSNAATDVTQLYIDGVLAGTTTTPAFTFTTFNNFEVGRLGRSSPTDAYSGSVDELRIYDSILPAEDIALLAVPEPGFSVLFGAGAVGSLLLRRRSSNRASL